MSDQGIHVGKNIRVGRNVKGNNRLMFYVLCEYYVHAYMHGVKD